MRRVLLTPHSSLLTPHSSLLTPHYNYVRLTVLANACEGCELRTSAYEPPTRGGESTAHLLKLQKPLCDHSLAPHYNYVCLTALANACEGCELRTSAYEPPTRGGESTAHLLKLQKLLCGHSLAPHYNYVCLTALANAREGCELIASAYEPPTRGGESTASLLKLQKPLCGHSSAPHYNYNYVCLTALANAREGCELIASAYEPPTRGGESTASLLKLQKLLCGRRGFTLMEIMVVIVVIGVLASVAGPMVGSFTDQAKVSATKEKLSALKSGILAYYADVGKFPSKGKPPKGEPPDGGPYYQGSIMGPCFEWNVLVNRDVKRYVCRKYKSKWKGPYMESDPEDFMYDAWGYIIRYVAIEGERSLYLWSAGPDNNFYGNKEPSTANATKGLKAILSGKPDASIEEDDVPLDDIIVSIGLKFKIKRGDGNSFVNYSADIDSYSDSYDKGAMPCDPKDEWPK